MGGRGQAVPGDAQAAGTSFAGQAITQDDEQRQCQAVRPQLDGLPASGRGPELPTLGVVAQAPGHRGITLLELSIAHTMP